MNDTPETVKEAVPTAPEAKTEAPKPSPAQDLRDIQALVINGIFPGNMAPAIMKAYQLLEKMCQEVENRATPK
jgi:hypothetical protein